MTIERWLSQNTASLRGKTIAVTGSTGGLGRELCHCLAAREAALILLDRNPQRSAAFRDELLHTYPAITVQCMTVDLEEIDSVRAVLPRLIVAAPDVFIHNAGAYSIPRKIVSTGYDNVFQINFLSPYYLIKGLLPTLAGRHGHVVAVGSIAHNYSRSDPDSVDFADRRAASKVYGNAKRYLMYALWELFADRQDVTLAITHPGISLTGITAHYPKPIFALIKHPMKILFMTPKKACLSIVKGVFEPCGYCRWIGPRRFNVWGFPKTKPLRTATEEERRRIFDTAERLAADTEKQKR